MTDRDPRTRTEARRPITRATSIVGATLASLLVLMACGGGDVGGDDASATASADTGPEGQAVAREGDAEQTQEESVEHTHGPGGTHTHAAADTIASGVALDAGSGQSWSGSATLLQVGDSVRILLSVERVPAETRYTAQLLAGSCEAPGAELASLTPVATGTSGRGSSQSTVPAARLEEHDHGALRLRAGDGSAAACAPVHLASSEHRHEQE